MNNKEILKQFWKYVGIKTEEEMEIKDVWETAWQKSEKQTLKKVLRALQAIYTEGESNIGNRINFKSTYKIIENFMENK